MVQLHHTKFDNTNKPYCSCHRTFSEDYSLINAKLQECKTLEHGNTPHIPTRMDAQHMSKTEAVRAPQRLSCCANKAENCTWYGACNIRSLSHATNDLNSKRIKGSHTDGKPRYFLRTFGQSSTDFFSTAVVCRLSNAQKRCVWSNRRTNFLYAGGDRVNLSPYTLFSAITNFPGRKCRYFVDSMSKHRQCRVHHPQERSWKVFSQNACRHTVWCST